MTRERTREILEEEDAEQVRLREEVAALEASAVELERQGRMAAAEAVRMAEEATTAADTVRALADPATLEAFEVYVDVRDRRDDALEDRARAGEQRAELLFLSFARADSIGQSAARQRDAALELVGDLERALEARTEDARRWEAAAGGTIFGVRVEPELAIAIGVGLGVLATR